MPAQMSSARQSPLTAAQEIGLARVSFDFLLDEMTNGVAGLDPLDALLVLAINQANIAPLTRDHDARARYGQLDAPAPDSERRPVSINAVAGSLGLPFETVRRRIRKLAGQDVCRLARDGVVVPAAFLASPDYVQSVLTGHERLRQFYLELRAQGFAQGLPPASYPLEGSIPVRAAARLLSDYVLRTTEGLMRLAPNVISLLILVALLQTALRRESGEAGVAPQSINALGRILRLPSETVRRHVGQLLDSGHGLRVSSGVLIPASVLAQPDLRQLLADNAVNVHRLLSGLAERSVILAWETGGALDGRAIA